MSKPELNLEPRERIVLPLDVSTYAAAETLVGNLAPYIGLCKVGLEMQHALGGPQSVAFVHGMLEQKVFYDCKIHDIPNTMVGAAKSIAAMKVMMFNIHASAGKKAIADVAKVKGESLLLGVTVLTSISDEECLSIFGDVPGSKVLQFAQMLVDHGADGIVCSPKELRLLGEKGLLEKLVSVIPGIRTERSKKNDQERITTPFEAIFCGADFIVVGRAITDDPDPVQAAKDVGQEIANAYNERS